MSEYYTLKQAANFLNVSDRTVIRYIKKKLICQSQVSDSGRMVKRIKKSELEKFLSTQIDRHKHSVGDNVSDSNTDKSVTSNRQDTDIKQLVKEAIQEERQTIMKPLEEQALYIAGALTKENQFLKERLETVLEENKFLNEQIKMLPGPVEEVSNKIEELIKEKEDTINTLNEEKALREQIQKEVNELKEQINLLPEPPVIILEKLQQKELELSNIQNEIIEKEKKFEVLKQEAEEQSTKLLKEKEEIVSKLKDELQEKEAIRKQSEEQSWELKSKINIIETEQKRTIRTLKNKNTYVKISIVTAVLLLLSLFLIVPKLLNLNEKLFQTQEQLRNIQMQATQKALEIDDLNRGNKEEILNKLNEAGELFNTKKYEESIKIYDTVLQIDPNNIVALDNKAEALYGLKRYEEAINYFNRVIELNPQLDRALYMKGQTLYQMGEYKKALQCYDKFLKYNPDNIESLISKAKTLYKLNKYNEALDCCNKALKLDPNNIEARALLNNGLIQ